ncbi:hypothetical protein JW935_10685 [candidate division KSB1 bacterium]|nr:hypothetical protein [candidate division KSB1 bacterium]
MTQEAGSNETNYDDLEFEFLQHGVTDELWKKIVDRYTDQVFYCARFFTRSDLKKTAKNYQLQYQTNDGKKFYYTEETITAYEWIWGEIRKKLDTFRGKCSLFAYLWNIIDVHQKKHFLRSDYLKWRYGNAYTLPKYIESLEDIYGIIYQYMFMKKSEEQIYHELSKKILMSKWLKKLKHVISRDKFNNTTIDIEKVRHYMQDVKNLLAKHQKLNLIQNKEDFPLNHDETWDPPEPKGISRDEKMILHKVIEIYYKVIKRLEQGECTLLKLWYQLKGSADDTEMVKKYNAGQVLKCYKRVRINLPGFKGDIDKATPKHVYKAVESVHNKVQRWMVDLLNQSNVAQVDRINIIEFFDNLGVSC